MNDSVFALVDCNNFFVSCERVFAPALEKQAVVVLSSNDGCAISRSNEAKALNIKMGAPFYQFKSLYEEKKLTVLSSNFPLYSNMSWRVMESLKQLSPSVEVYSIDEAFIGLEQLNIKDYSKFGQETKKQLQQWTGIPVSIGIATTKTLAKIANRLAKTKSLGVYNLVGDPNLDHVLSAFQVEDIWGIGKKLAPRLRMMGIGSAKDLRDSDPHFIRKSFSVVVERIIYELRGTSCLELTTLHEEKKSITYSRSFGDPVIAIEELEEALSDYISNACHKLRKQSSRAKSICIFLSTNTYNTKLPQYKNSILCPLPHPSSNTSEIISYGKKYLHRLYKPGYQYHQLGVILLELQPTAVEQLQMFHNTNYKHADKLMKTLDKINKTMGKNSLFIAAQGTERAWKSQSLKCSPNYTNNWTQLPRVK